MGSALSLAFYLLLVIISVILILALSAVLVRRPITPGKELPYECGMLPIEKPQSRFPVHFYRVALLFVIFDVEIVFLYLWAVVVKNLGIFGLIEMFIFIGILLVALAYVWRKGYLRWDQT